MTSTTHRLSSGRSPLNLSVEILQFADPDIRLQEQVEKAHEQVFVLLSAEKILETPIGERVDRPFARSLIVRTHNLLSFIGSRAKIRPADLQKKVPMFETQIKME